MLLRLLVVTLTLTAAAQEAVVRTFDADTTGQAPAGFRFEVAREAAPGGWQVQRDAGNAVLTHQSGAGAPGGFALAVYEGAQYGDAELSVRLKASGGSRTGGIIWRYQDPLNYYAVHLDLAEQELEVHRFVRGNRIRMEREDDLELDPDAWHTLRVVQDDDAVRVYLGGIRVFRDRDRTFPGPGAVGLWTAGDAVVSFDDFRVETLTERER